MSTEPTAAPAVALSEEQFTKLLSALGQNVGGLSKEDLAEILARTSKDTAKALDPENRRHPEKSAMSYPEGDMVRPRPRLPFEILWNGYPQHKFQEELHWSEAELMCQLQPGEFNCTRKDGSTTFPITVKAERDGNGKLTKLDVTFSVRREEKDQIPPLYVMLYQMVKGGAHRNPRESYVQGMAGYLDVMYLDAEAKQPAAV